MAGQAVLGEAILKETQAAEAEAAPTIEGLVALDINVGVNEVVEAAKMSVKNGQAVKLPLKEH